MQSENGWSWLLYPLLPNIDLIYYTCSKFWKVLTGDQNPTTWCEAAACSMSALKLSVRPVVQARHWLSLIHTCQPCIYRVRPRSVNLSHPTHMKSELYNVGWWLVNTNWTGKLKLQQCSSKKFEMVARINCFQTHTCKLAVRRKSCSSTQVIDYSVLIIWVNFSINLGTVRLEGCSSLPRFVLFRIHACGLTNLESLDVVGHGPVSLSTAERSSSLSKPACNNTTSRKLCIGRPGSEMQLGTFVLRQ